MVIVGLFLNKELRTGANRRYLELMESLAARGNHVYVVMNTLLDYRPQMFTGISLNIPYVRRGFPPASWLFRKKSPAILKALREQMDARGDTNVNWILIHGDMHLSLALSLRKALSCRLFFAYRCNDILRAKLVRSSGGLSAREFASSLLHEMLDRYRERQVSRKADLVTFQNTSDCNDFQRRTGFPDERTVIIPGNIGLPRFTDEWHDKNASTAVRRLVYVGVLSVSKGLQYLIEALSILVSRGYKDLSLTILGKTENAEQTFKLVEAFGLTSMVTFAGYALPFPYLASCDLMVFPSLYDAFPDTLLESLHVGCPVIASNRGGIPDILPGREFLFEPADTKDIADRIERCIQDPSYYRHLREVCRSRAEAFRFDWAAEWEKVLLGR